MPRKVSVPQVVVQSKIPPITPPQQSPQNLPTSKQVSVASMMSPSSQDGPKIDFEMVLLSLSDEYIEAAYKLGPQVADVNGGVDKAALDKYHGLIAAGLGCLEASLKNFKLSPRMEAAITLRYASLMYDETENFDHMESILSKGVGFPSYFAPVQTD